MYILWFLQVSGSEHGIICAGEIFDQLKKRAKLSAARLTVYAGEEDDTYITYMTPSAYRDLSDWMKFREESGEVITDKSWVMRDLWDTQVKISKGLVTIPKQLTSIGVKRLMERAIWAQGLRKELEAGKEEASVSHEPFIEKSTSKQDVN